MHDMAHGCDTAHAVAEHYCDARPEKCFQGIAAYGTHYIARMQEMNRTGVHVLLEAPGLKIRGGPAADAYMVWSFPLNEDRPDSSTPFLSALARPS